MKKVLLSFFCLVYAFVVYAGPVSEQQALAKASKFMPGKGFVMAKAAESAKKGPGSSAPYYVFNADGNGGFVIVSGDDRTKPILGYSKTGTFNENALPENVKWWLDYYAKAISSLGYSPAVAQNDGVATTERSEIEPLVETQWDQVAPYNDMCVFDDLGRCLTGCVATAMAQVVNYYKYPDSLPEIDAYTAIWSENEFDALPATTLNWRDMTDEDIAKLCRYCGQSVEMDYGQDASSAVSEYVSLALVKYFGYNKSTHAIYRDGYSPEDWENEIYEELAGGNPIVYSGSSIYGSGHAFVVDGYKDGLFHVNWGWGGWYDSYFVLTIMDSMGPDYPNWTYSEEQAAIVGVRPIEGGTLDYPLMTISQLELAEGQDREVTRESADDDFYVSIYYLVNNSANSEDDLGGMGLALYKGDEMVRHLMQYGPSALRVGWYYYGTLGCSFGSGLEDGTYRIEAIYVDGDYNVHKTQGFGYRYVEAVIKDNKLSLTNYPCMGEVKLNKSEVTIEKGKTVTLKATVSPETLEDQSVTWESSDPTIAKVSNSGKVKGLKAGTATITCTLNATGQSATCEVTVGYVKLNDTEVSVEKGKTLTLKAKVYPTTLDQSVTWKSSDKNVATVTSAGKVKGVGAGTATITCTSKATGLKSTCVVTVGYVKLSDTEVAIEKGKTMTLKAKVYPKTVEDQSVTWESSDPTIVKVANTGKIKGMKAGTATITCTSNATGLKATCEVTVGYVKLSNTEVTIEKGKTMTLKSKVYPSTLDQSVTWESSDPTIVKVGSTGKIKGVKTGTAIITCTSDATGLKATCEVTVVKASSAPSLDGTDDEVTGIEEKAALAEEFDVYDLNGRRVLNKVTSLEGLTDGVYIVNGKKVVIK